MNEKDFPFGPVPGPIKNDLINLILIMKVDLGMMMEVIKKMHNQIYEMQEIYVRYIEKLSDEQVDNKE